MMLPLMMALFALQASSQILCTENTDCPSGFFCKGSGEACFQQSICHRLPILDEECHEDAINCLSSTCVGGLKCVDHRCVLPPFACATNDDCLHGKYCSKSNGPDGPNAELGYCADLPGLGQPCGHKYYNPQCRYGYECNAVTQRCFQIDPRNLPPKPAAPARTCLEIGCGGYREDKACQCDEQCEEYGDCCRDAVSKCENATLAPSTLPTTLATTPEVTTTQTTTETTTPAPAGRLCENVGCGGFVPGVECNCDEECAAYEDCCADYNAWCLGQGPFDPIPPPPPPNIDPLPLPNKDTVCQPGFVPRGADTCVEYEWISTQDGPIELRRPPAPLAEVSAVVINQQVVFFGDGTLGTTNNKKTNIYDIPSGKFENPYTRAQRPYPGDHSAVVVFNDRMYAFGGLCCQQFCEGCNATGKTQIYDPAKNEWLQGSEIPWEVEGASLAAAIGTSIFLCGGLNGFNPTPKCGIYTPATDSWATMADMPKAVHHAAAGTDGDRFFIFGGRIGSNGLSEGQPDVQIYDPKTQTWEWSGTGDVAPLPNPRTGMGCAAYLAGEFYVMGGEEFPNSGHPEIKEVGTFAIVDIYNPRTNTWRDGTDMAIAMHGICPVVHAETVYIIAGGPQIDRGSSDEFQIFRPKA